MGFTGKYYYINECTLNFDPADDLFILVLAEELGFGFFNYSKALFFNKKIQSLYFSSL